MQSPREVRQAVFALILGAALSLCPNAAWPRTLEFVEQHLDVNLSGARTLAISPDGSHVYVGGSWTLAFERDSATGELSYLDATQGAHFMAISPDGRNLYLNKEGFGALSVLRRDPRSGAITLLEEWDDRMADFEILSPTSVAVSPDGRHVYVATDRSSLVVFVRDPSTGVLTYLERQLEGVDGVTGLDIARHVVVSPDGNQVVVAGSPWRSGLSGVTFFERNPTSGRLSFQGTLSGDPDGIEALDGARFAHISSDGRHLYVAAADGIVIFARDDTGGVPSLLGVLDRGADALATNSDGTYLYTVDHQQAAVTVLARDPSSGTLSLIETYSEGLDGLEGFAAVALTADGRHLYVASRPDGGAVAVLTRDPASGRLGFVATASGDVAGDAEDLRYANSLAASPDGQHLYVVTDLGRISAYSRSVETGGLQAIASYGRTDGFDGLRDAESVTVSPDGRNVYVASSRPDHALVVLARHPTGELAPLEAHHDDTSRVDGLRDAHFVTVSPDGRNVYVAGRGDGAVAVFARDLTSGQLEFLEAQFDGADGVDGLWAVRAVTVSPDGEHVYAASDGDRAVVAFDRDTETGRLEFLEATFGSDGGAEGLYTGPNAITVSPDGENVYVGTSGAMVAFARDTTSGALSFLENHFAGVYTGHSLAISPNGEAVYVFGSKLTVFLRHPTTGTLELIETESFPRYPFYRSLVGTLSPDGRHLYVAALIGFDHALLVLLRADGLCQRTAQNLCLAGDRFRVELEWRDPTGRTGSAHAVPAGTDDSGMLWFFSADNWEMLIKVLDGCAINDRFWLLAASNTDVEFTLRVTDLQANVTRSYFNPLGNATPAIIDTFETCEASGARQPPTVTLSVAAPETWPAVDPWAVADEPIFEEILPARSETPKSQLAHHLLVGAGGKCLDIEGGVATDGTPVNVFDCHRKPNQRWRFFYPCHEGECDDEFEIRGLDGQCLQPATGSESTPLVVGSCGGPEDRWVSDGYFPDHIRLEHVASGQCADVLGGSSENGTPVHLYDCHGGANQLWDYHEIRCVDSPIHRCLNQYRFQVEVEWRDFEGNTGFGRAVRQGSPDSGLYWFFDPGNWEMLIKVLDGCNLNDRHWVFAAATTTVEYTLRVTDTETGQVREYFNPLGRAAPAITDTSAFATCLSPGHY